MGLYIEGPPSPWWVQNLQLGLSTFTKVEVSCEALFPNKDLEQHILSVLAVKKAEAMQSIQNPWPGATALRRVLQQQLWFLMLPVATVARLLQGH